MKKILFALLLISGFAYGQTPPGYTKISSRYEWIATMADSGMHIPRYCGVPTLRSGVFNGDGQIGIDTCNHKLYIYSNGWKAITNEAQFLDSIAALRADIGTGGGVGYPPRRSIELGGSPDSLQLVNDEAAPGNNKVYGTDTGGVKGYQDAILVDTSGSLDGYEAYLDKPNNTVKFRAATGGGVHGYIRILVDGDSPMPVTGDTSITSGYFYNKTITIDGIRPSEWFIVDSTIFFTRPLTIADTMDIEAWDSSSIEVITLTSPPAGPDYLVESVTSGGTITESPAHTFTQATSTPYTVFTPNIPSSANMELIWEVTSGSQEAVAVGLDVNNTNNNYFSGTGVWAYTAYIFSGSLNYIEAGGAVISPVSLSSGAGVFLKLKRAGSTVTLEYSTNSGSSWTVGHTYSVTTTAALYPKAAFPVSSKSLVNARLE